MTQEEIKKLEERLEHINRQIIHNSKYQAPIEYMNHLYGQRDSIQWVLDGMKDESE